MVIQWTIVLLAVGFLVWTGIVGTTAWLSERAQFFARCGCAQHPLSAVELRNALQVAEASQRGYLTGGNEIYLAPLRQCQSDGGAPARGPEGQLANDASVAPMLARLATVVVDKIERDGPDRLPRRDMRDATHWRCSAPTAARR